MPKRKSYSVQEKLEIVDRVRGNESQAQVSKATGVPESTLRGWLKEEHKLRDLVNAIDAKEDIVRKRTRTAAAPSDLDDDCPVAANQTREVDSKADIESEEPEAEPEAGPSRMPSSAEFISAAEALLKMAEYMGEDLPVILRCRYMVTLAKKYKSQNTRQLAKKYKSQKTRQLTLTEMLKR